MRVKLNCKWLHRQWVARVFSNSLFLFLLTDSILLFLLLLLLALVLVQLLLPSPSAPSSFVFVCVHRECVHLHHQASTIDSQHCLSEKNNWEKNSLSSTSSTSSIQPASFSHNRARHRNTSQRLWLSSSSTAETAQIALTGKERKRAREREEKIRDRERERKHTFFHLLFASSCSSLLLLFSPLSSPLAFKPRMNKTETHARNEHF